MGVDDGGSLEWRCVLLERGVAMCDSDNAAATVHLLYCWRSPPFSGLFEMARDP